MSEHQQADSMIPKQRLAMVIEFDGALFHGWQRQNNAFTVQEACENAIAAIEGELSQPNFVAAGRTDSGVHATHMLIHADVLESRWRKSPHAYVQGMNHKLPDGVAVHGVKAVAHDFHARFACVQRRYQYKIWNRSVASVLNQRHAWWVGQALNVANMQQAATYLLGKHDFTSFRAASCQAHSAQRTIHHLDIQQNGHEITVDVAADAFLYHMVRNLVGSLVAVGVGRWQADKIATLLQEKDRTQAAQTAPAHGLYFTDAIYAEFSAQDISGLVG
ncbi:MAG: tRNA pseudouridine(38-40) synthase TruA [Mariprofundaceae bacterium]|nr:tRNA pseudouridine(38-40) synthase TruA [Mariprofundaceae bacterium]